MKPTLAVLTLLRSLWHLAAIAAVTVLGFVWWELPLPGIFAGVAVLLVSVLVWALFLSPRPAIKRVDRLLQSLVELLLLAAGVAAAMLLGIPWIAAAAFGVTGAVLGFVVGIPRRA